MENKNETFTYTYSAKQQEEIKGIRQKYVPKEENKMEQLRNLDKSAEMPGRLISLTVGIISALVLGVGMCCAMVWAGNLFIPGIIIGLFGIAGVSVAYPMFNMITKKQREKLTPQIMKLSEEVMLQK